MKLAATSQDEKYSFVLPLLTHVVALEPSVPRPKPTAWFVGYLSFIGEIHMKSVSLYVLFF
jgi:hypothetical protein